MPLAAMFSRKHINFVVVVVDDVACTLPSATATNIQAET